MAISFVNQVSAATDNATLPSFQASDLLVVFAFRNALTAPTIPAGFGTISTQSANGLSFSVGYKFIGPSDTSTGIWTNATMVFAVIYRGVSRYGGSGSVTNVSSTTYTSSGHTMNITTGNSWVVYYNGSLQTTSMSTATGLTLRSTQVGTTQMGIVMDTNGGTTSAPQKTGTNGTTAANGGGSFELVPSNGNSFNNYMFLDTPNGISAGERVK